MDAELSCVPSKFRCGSTEMLGELLSTWVGVLCIGSSDSACSLYVQITGKEKLSEMD